MKVKELINKLKKFDPEGEVYGPVPDSGGYDWCVGKPTVVRKCIDGVWVGHDVRNLTQEDFEG